ISSQDQLPDALHRSSAQERLQPAAFPLCEHSISYFSVHSLFLSISEHNLYYETFPVLSTVFGTYGSHHFVDKYTLQLDRKSTRLNSSHVSISYAVFCLKKKKINKTETL